MMPRPFADSYDFALSPDGQWAAALTGTRLTCYKLPQTADSLPLAPVAPAVEIERSGSGGRIVFVEPQRLLHIFLEPSQSDDPALIAAELLDVPSLQPVGPLVRIAGAQRIVGVGPVGAVVAPNGPGADVLFLRNGELSLQRTFMRGEVLSAVPAPDRRFLLEQRSGFDLWDVATHSAVSRLVLQTRQASLQVGYVSSGRLLFALASGPPVHIEIFRASDGRRHLEQSHPGVGVWAASGPGRLVIAIEERSGPALLDLELGSGQLRQLPLSSDGGKLLGFAVTPSLTAPEILLLSESQRPNLWRQPLPPIKLPAGSEPPESPTLLGASLLRTRSPFVQGAADAGLRRGRSRSSAFPSEPPPDLFLDAFAADPPPELLTAEPAAGDDSDLAVPTPAEPRPPLAATFDAPAVAAPPPRESEWRRRPPLLEHRHDPASSAAAWQWELLRWAERARLSDEGATEPPPARGPLGELAQRLALSAAAEQLLALLYAGQYLSGSRRSGQFPLELIRSLQLLHDEPTLLAELLPAAPLRLQRLVEQRPDGRLQVQREVAARLLALPCPQLTASGGLDREPLPPGLYSHLGPFSRGSRLLGRQPLLPLDMLSERRLLPTLSRRLAQAIAYDALLLLDGLPGVARPTFTSLDLLQRLRPLLLDPPVPLIVCAMADGLVSLGLAARPLPGELLLSKSAPGAPLLPSAPLPLGTSWRSPTLPAPAALLPKPSSSGRLELSVPSERRAAVVVSASASAESCATAAYLAARDGALLSFESELSGNAVQLVALLLRQLPVLIAAVPPGGPQAPWPPILAPFAQSPPRSG